MKQFVGGLVAGVAGTLLLVIVGAFTLAPGMMILER